MVTITSLHQGSTYIFEGQFKNLQKTLTELPHVKDIRLIQNETKQTLEIDIDHEFDLDSAFELGMLTQAILWK